MAGPAVDRIRVDLIGAGNFASKVLLPPLAGDEHVCLGTVATASGTGATHVAKRWGFQTASSDPVLVLQEAGAAAVIATRHAAHAPLVTVAAPNKRAVFVEKPLAVTPDQLADLKEVPGSEKVMVGFNRRFSPAVADLLPHLRSRRGPVNTVVRVNAGALPPDHWLMTRGEGGRIIGEVCHFVDLACYLAGSSIRSLAAVGSGSEPLLDDRVSVAFSHDDGSTTSLVYTSGGSDRLAKEHIEVHWDGDSAVIDDFHSWTFHRASRSSTRKVRGQDKGHRAEVEAFIAFARGLEPNPVPFAQSVHVTEATFAIVESLRTQTMVTVPGGTTWG